MDQQWFEMGDIRRRKLNKSVWIPLRASRTQTIGRFGYLGFKEEFFGCASLAVPVDQKSAAVDLPLTSLNITNTGYYENEKYTPADVYENYTGELLGLRLVLEQKVNSLELTEWHLHQDFVLTLGLIKERNVWVSPNEGYIQVARLHTESNGKPFLLEVRAEHLKDYLCARNMGLYIASFFSRDIVVDDASFISWEKGSRSEKNEHENWEGRVITIHEGGHPYGEKAAIFHVSRTDVDESDDVPDISSNPTSENTTSSSWEREFRGKKLYTVLGELWRSDWIEPAKMSARVREDKAQPTVFFIVDEQGNKENQETLIKGGKWLWFKPDVIMALAHRRGGGLAWYTRDTGSVHCSPDHGVHFGVNPLGLVNVYAKDVAMLPEWHQQIWAGHNVSPDGGVSEELLASQVRANPADTQAPEPHLKFAIEIANELAEKELHISLFREHDALPELFEKTHRFRAVDDNGLFALAKDVARLIADNLNTDALQSVAPPPPKTKWGSLKSLENFLALKVDQEIARSITGPLVGVWELRHADAHLPGKEIEEAFSLLRVDRSLPTIIQGYQLIHACVSSIYEVTSILEEWNKSG